MGMLSVFFSHITTFYFRIFLYRYVQSLAEQASKYLFLELVVVVIVPKYIIFEAISPNANETGRKQSGRD